MYVLHVTGADLTGADLRAWAPGVPGIAEVFHARFTDHAYPVHAHDTWTVLVVDQGVIRYDLHRHEHGALPTVVTLLPPHVAHTGRSATEHGSAVRASRRLGRSNERLV